MQSWALSKIWINKTLKLKFLDEFLKYKIQFKSLSRANYQPFLVLMHIICFFRFFFAHMMMDGSMTSTRGPGQYPSMVLNLVVNMYYDYDYWIKYLLVEYIYHEHTLHWVYLNHAFKWSIYALLATSILLSTRFQFMHSTGTPPFCILVRVRGYLSDYDEALLVIFNWWCGLWSFLFLCWSFSWVDDLSSIC